MVAAAAAAAVASKLTLRFGAILRATPHARGVSSCTALDVSLSHSPYTYVGMHNCFQTDSSATVLLNCSFYFGIAWEKRAPQAGRRQRPCALPAPKTILLCNVDMYMHAVRDVCSYFKLASLAFHHCSRPFNSGRLSTIQHESTRACMIQPPRDTYMYVRPWCLVC